MTFIVDALAKREGISVSDNEVFQTIYYEAMMMGQNPNQVIEYYKNNNILPAVKMAMIEDRILHHLLDSKADKSPKSASKPKSEDKADKVEKAQDKPKAPKKTTKKDAK